MKTWLIKLSIGKIIPLDKMLHFFVGFFLSTLFSGILPLWLNIEIIIVIAILKEVFDVKVKNSSYDVKDILATVLGSIISILYLYVIFD